MTSLIQGLSSSTREEKERRPGNEVAAVNVSLTCRCQSLHFVHTLKINAYNDEPKMSPRP